MSDLVDVIGDSVAWHRRFAKFSFVDREKIEHRAVARGLVHLTQAQHTRGLRHALDQEHARHHRVVGKMTEEMRLVESDVFDPDAVILAANVDDAVDHDKGVAMRKEPQDLPDIGALKRLAAHSSVPSSLREALSRRTRRRTMA